MCASSRMVVASADPEVQLPALHCLISAAPSARPLQLCICLCNSESQGHYIETQWPHFSPWKLLSARFMSSRSRKPFFLFQRRLGSWPDSWLLARFITWRAGRGRGGANESYVSSSVREWKQRWGAGRRRSEECCREGGHELEGKD